MANLKIDGARLWDSLMTMAQIGGTAKGGCNRQTLTDEDREGRALFAQWCRDAGLSLAVDTMGNMFATRPGTDPAALPVLVGSHLDTQPTGGKYDGVLGVLGALEVVRTLNDLGIRTRHPVTIVNWTNEEGARFAPAMLGSAVHAGAVTQDWAYARTDGAGLTVGAELARIGYVGDQPVGQIPAHAYYELHIEQGPILEAEGKDVGVVTHCQGLRWLEVTLTGRDAHTGSTPMTRRRDALLAAARIVETVNRIALAHGPHAVGSVGWLNVQPNSRNIIPGQVTFCIDIRSPSLDTLLTMEAEVRSAIAAIIAPAGIEAAIVQVGAFDPVTFAPPLVDTIRRVSESLGFSHQDIISGAGHDACHMAKITPSAMIFCPCVDGLSHNEAEEIHPHWARAGTEVLLHAVLDTAGLVA